MDYVARTPEQLGRILKAIRLARPLTQTEVASRVGLRQAQVSVVETQGADISVDTLYRLLSALGLELVVRDPPPPDDRPSEW